MCAHALMWMLLHVYLPVLVLWVIGGWPGGAILEPWSQLVLGEIQSDIQGNISFSDKKTLFYG